MFKPTKQCRATVLPSAPTHDVRDHACMSLGDLIRQARDRKKISQRALARKLGVSNGAVSQWEAGIAKPQVENLIGLRMVLDLELPVPGASGSPYPGEFVEDLDELALLGFWRSLKDPAERRLVLRMLWTAKERPSAA